MTDRATRLWSFKAQFENKAAFLIGNITLPNHARFDEVEAAGIALWQSVFPFSPPKLVPIAGMIWFVPESDEA